MKKSFLKNAVPDYHFKSVADIPVNLFTGSQLIMLDLDNTLVFSETAETTPAITAWLNEMKKNYRCIIFSNSFTYYDRAEKISTLFDCELFLSKNKKPFKKLFYQLQEKYGVPAEYMVVIGDRVMTDVLFGNRNRAVTVLTDSLGGKESFYIYVTRIVDKIALFVGQHM